MKTLIEDLWYNYQLGKNVGTSQVRKEMLHNVTEKQNELCSQLDKSQIKLFEEYEELYGILNCETEKDSFADGVRFAVLLILEACKQ